ncbi:protein-glutamate O-methyltransferase CheR [Anaerovorax odorimutans]|uniref:protein-glutamate O-methyltransferase n=1 Tax=Anaerovorax odorimutans TaxID=109327 RepID=A0ABT1RP22_9FIRM|nr:protein-glutamate O-methyltransferase CheR [Anaerovorax odorimutans]
MIRLEEQEFADIVEYMLGHYGINLEKKKVLIECRMARELEKQGMTSFRGYLELLKKDRTGKIADEMINRLTTNYTYFFREVNHFQILKSEIFPDLFQKKQFGTVNIWCAGCSTGEECYTLTMTLREYTALTGQSASVRILATDISEDALRRAREGIYPIREIESIPLNLRQEYCHVTEDKKSFRIDDRLKENICFKRQNLMDPAAAEKYDLILCRNVMIYFDRASRRKLIKKLENCLTPGGYLLIGHAELLAKEETCLESVHPAVYMANGKERKNL